MPQIIIAKYAGVCFGVSRALELLENALGKGRDLNKNVFMLGPLIHNPRVIGEYEKMGVKITATHDNCDEGVVVIRSHGITLEEEKALYALENIVVEDTTCPFVKKIHRIVEQKSSLGFAVVVLGDKEHSEVQGIISRIKGDCLVVPPDDFSSLQPFVLKHDKILAVAQTTSQPAHFESLTREMESLCKNKECLFENTVCDATLQRQSAAKELAGRVDYMIVIGGKNSSNTSKLFSIVSAENKNSIWIESPADLDENICGDLKNKKTIGITAGASTPDIQIKELVSFLEKL